MPNSKWIAALLVGTGLAASAQKEDSLLQRRYDIQKANKAFFERVATFSEVSWATLPYCDLGSEKGSYVLTADIQPHFMIGGETMRPVVRLTPRFKVRMFWDNEKWGDSSLAVRTPSYMPGATVFYPLKRIKQTYDPVTFLSLAFFHHSNGQDGEEIKADGSYNTYNGNFSTNFFEVAFWYNKRTKIRPYSSVMCPTAAYDSNYYDKFVKLGVEQHFSTAYAQRGRYSRTRINFYGGLVKVTNWRLRVRDEQQQEKWDQVGSCYRKERYRILATASLLVDKLDKPWSNLDRRINLELGYYRRFLSGNTAAFLAAGYFGSDTYNAYFEKSYPYIRIGLSLGFFVHTSKIQD